MNIFQNYLIVGLIKSSQEAFSTDFHNFSDYNNYYDNTFDGRQITFEDPHHPGYFWLDSSLS